MPINSKSEIAQSEMNKEGSDSAFFNAFSLSLPVTCLFTKFPPCALLVISLPPRLVLCTVVYFKNVLKPNLQGVPTKRKGPSSTRRTSEKTKRSRSEEHTSELQ